MLINWAASAIFVWARGVRGFPVLLCVLGFFWSILWCLMFKIGGRIWLCSFSARGVPRSGLECSLQKSTAGGAVWGLVRSDTASNQCGFQTRFCRISFLSGCEFGKNLWLCKGRRMSELSFSVLGAGKTVIISIHLNRIEYVIRCCCFMSCSGLPSEDIASK